MLQPNHPPTRVPTSDPARRPAGGGQPARGGGHALLACAAVLGAASVADAGVTLLSRQTNLRVVGGSVGSTGGGPGGIDDAATFSSFDRFADTVGSDTASGGVLASAQQYSVPSAAADAAGHGFVGAFGEGSVRSDVVTGAGVANATSDLDLVFRVDGGPVGYTLAGTIGASGGGSAMVQVIPMLVGHDAPIYSAVLSPRAADEPDRGAAIDYDGTLAPGDYMLRVQAGASDTAAAGPEGSSYYNFTFAVSQASNPPPAAVPLPPAAFVGGAVMGLIGLARHRRRVRMKAEG